MTLVRLEPSPTNLLAVTVPPTPTPPETINAPVVVDILVFVAYIIICVAVVTTTSANPSGFNTRLAFEPAGVVI